MRFYFSAMPNSKMPSLQGELTITEKGLSLSYGSSSMNAMLRPAHVTALQASARAKSRDVGVRQEQKIWFSFQAGRPTKVDVNLAMEDAQESV